MLIFRVIFTIVYLHLLQLIFTYIRVFVSLSSPPQHTFKECSAGRCEYNFFRIRPFICSCVLLYLEPLFTMVSRIFESRRTSRSVCKISTNFKSIINKNFFRIKKDTLPRAKICAHIFSLKSFEASFATKTATQNKKSVQRKSPDAFILLRFRDRTPRKRLHITNALLYH